jgi:hypothetical protein
MPEWQDSWIPESERSLNVTEVDLSRRLLILRPDSEAPYILLEIQYL